MSLVTLIGTRLAEVGVEFTYEGAAPACEGCPYREQCLNLAEGQRYRITDVRDNTQTLECGVHDDGVRAVEVEPAAVMANVASRDAYAGSNAGLVGECQYTECPSHEFCEPAGAAVGETYQIDEVLGDPPHDHCMLGRELTLVELAAPEH